MSYEFQTVRYRKKAWEFSRTRGEKVYPQTRVRKLQVGGGEQAGSTNKPSTP